MFVAECDPDVALVEILTSPSRRRIKHAGGKSMVIRKLMRSHENSIGIIDEDPNRFQPEDIQRFTETNFMNRDQIRILHHNQRNNRLIVLCPRLEEWIIGASREAHMDLRNYNLPNDPNQLHEIINIRITKFRQLVKDLLRQRSSRVRSLRIWLMETQSRP